MEAVNNKENKSDPQDSAEWVDAYGDYLFRYAMQRVRSRELAEDLVQDAFLSAHKAFDKFEGKASVKTWLVSILRNKIIDHMRRAKKVEFVSYDSATSESSEESFNSFGIWKKLVSGWSGTPAELMESKDFLAQLKSCLSGLPDSMQQVLLLKVVDQLSTKEICDELEINENNVWVILHRARLKLRQCLDVNWFAES